MLALIITSCLYMQNIPVFLACLACGSMSILWHKMTNLCLVRAGYTVHGYTYTYLTRRCVDRTENAVFLVRPSCQSMSVL